MLITGRYSTTWQYDTSGRIGTVGWDAGGQTGSVTYGRLANSDRLAQMISTDGFGIYYTYEDHRDLRTQVANRYGSTLISSYGYTYDAVGNRNQATQDGRIFLEALSQRALDGNWINSVTPGGTQVDDPSAQYAYTYDPINNRSTDTSWDDPAQALVQRTYANNNLNQTTEVQKSAATYSLTYDADGNMTGLQTETKDLVLTYNAENRLVQAEPRLVTEGGQRGIYVYDYMGRRVEKQVYTFTSSAWQLTGHRQFVYDGWNLIEEIDLIPATPESKYYVWGLDLSESLQGAGGIGGLIAVLQSTGTDYACFDGNGNLGQLVKSGSGTVVAHYEYDPFGSIIAAMGDRVDENTFRFSTKYQDKETEFYYYGYRYYSSGLGRWINRDPVEEQGGRNLYVYGSNSPISDYDLFGLTTVSEILESFFSPSTEERLWIMGEGDEYTGKMREWEVVKEKLDLIKRNLKQNCEDWKSNHITSPYWFPNRSDRPYVDPQAFKKWVPSPRGTDPKTAKKAWDYYRKTGIIPNALWYAAVGSFGIYTTVDDIDCCKKEATLKIWLYNAMDQESFSLPLTILYRLLTPGKQGMARQYMWWNWTERYSWKIYRGL